MPPRTAMSRRTLLRRAALAAGTLAVAGPLAACAGRPEPPVTSGPVSLALWTHDDGYVDFFGASVGDVARAGRFRPDLDITKIGAKDIPTKVIAQAVAGSGTPDIAGFEVGNFARMLRGDIASQLLAPLDAAVAPFRSDLVGARVAPFSKDGRLYALDSDTPMAIYYYREDEFRRLGLPDDLGTWEEFARVGAQLAARDGVAFGALAVGSEQEQILQGYELLLRQRGGRFFDEQGALDIETPEAEEALRFAVDGLRSGFLITVSDYFGAAMQAALQTGRLIGIDMPSWFSTFAIEPNVPEQSGRWRVRPLPRFAGGGGRTAVGGGTGFSVLRDKPGTEAATDVVVSTYLGPGQQVRRYRELGYLPTLRSVYDDPALLTLGNEFLGGQRPFEIYRDIVDEAPVVHPSQNQFVLTTVLAGYLVRAYRGDLSPAEALSAAAEDFRGQTRA